jgi:hypothetical protein
MQDGYVNGIGALTNAQPIMDQYRFDLSAIPDSSKTIYIQLSMNTQSRSAADVITPGTANAVSAGITVHGNTALTSVAIGD